MDIIHESQLDSFVTGSIDGNHVRRPHGRTDVSYGAK